MDDQYNLTSRMFKAQAGFNILRSNRRYVHSNFRVLKKFKSVENDMNNWQFSCSDFTPCGNMIIAGTQKGEIKLFNINGPNEEIAFPCHTSSFEMVKCSSDGTLLLTCETWSSPLSALWSMENKKLTRKLEFDDDFYVEFANMSTIKVLGTNIETACMYDLTSGHIVSVYKPSNPNLYKKKRATFYSTDEMILFDGVLFDVKSGREIHNFSTLNGKVAGVFHPNGNEIISNTEIWDLRTFHLLQTIPVLDGCMVKFSSQNVIYAFNICTEDDNFNVENTIDFNTSFKIFDSYDYSKISEIDVKKNIFDLSVNKLGSLISLVECLPCYENTDQTYLKIYAVGMKKNLGEGPFVVGVDETSAEESVSDESEGERRIRRYHREGLSPHFNSDEDDQIESSDTSSEELNDEEESENDGEFQSSNSSSSSPPSIDIDFDMLE